MKFTIFGGLAVLPVGMWFGLNIANDKPLLSNPFAEPPAESDRGCTRLTG